MEVLSSAEEVLDALGGPAAAGRLVGRSVQSATNWKRAGKLPADTFLIFSNALRERGKAAPASIWGIKEHA